MYLLFDLDGTLTEPSLGITNSIKYALEKFGIKEHDEQKLRLCIGPPLIDSFIKFWGFDKETAVKAVAYYREYFAPKGIFENEVYDGIPEMLCRLKAAGHRIILATSKPQEFASQILKHFNIEQYFTAVVGNTLKEERPKKEDVLYYIKELYPDLCPDNALMIGDRMYDVQGAAALGLKCIGVLYGHGSQTELQKAGAWRLVPTVTQLEKCIEEANI